MDERLRFVARLLDGEEMAALCRESDVSRKTGYKILTLTRTAASTDSPIAPNSLHPSDRSLHSRSYRTDPASVR